jgi:hypothetical protein
MASGRLCVTIIGVWQKLKLCADDSGTDTPLVRRAVQSLDGERAGSGT